MERLERILRTRGDVRRGNPVTEATFRKAEHALATTFPASLKEYLIRFGHIEVGHWEFFGLGEDIPEYLDIVRITSSERTESGCPLPAYLLPILNDGAGNLYCVVALPNQSGTVVFWDHEAGPSQVTEMRATTLEDWMVEFIRDLDET